MAEESFTAPEKMEIGTGYGTVKMVWISTAIFLTSLPVCYIVPEIFPSMTREEFYLLISGSAMFLLLAVVGLTILYSVPLSITLAERSIVFEYWLPLSKYPREIPWEDIKQIEDYGLLSTRRGEVLALGQMGVEKEQIERLRNRFHEITGRKTDNSAAGAPAEILAAAGEEGRKRGCGNSVVIEKRDIVGGAAVLGMGFAPALYVAWASYAGSTDISISREWRYVFSGFMLMVSLLALAFGIWRLKSRRISIGPAGVEYTQGREEIFRYSWNEVKVIKLYKNQIRYPRPHLMFQGLFEEKYDAGTIDSDDYTTDEFEKIVRIVAEYALCHRIRFEDHIGWPDNYDSSFKKLFEIMGSETPEANSAGGPPVPIEVK